VLVRAFALVGGVERMRTYTEILPVLCDGGKVGLLDATVVRG
jgi:hypothetical protein